MKESRKKILLVNKFLYPNGGSETYIFELGRQFQKMGHEVQYFGMEHKGRIAGNRVESYTSDMNFHDKGIKKILYPFKIIYSIEARKKIRRVLDDFEPDVVHLNNFNFQITPSIIYEIKRWEKKTGNRIVLIYTAHDYQWVCPNHMMKIPAKNELCFQCQGKKFSRCIKNKCIHNSRVKSILGTLEAELYYFLKTYNKIDCILCPSYFMKEKLSVNPLLAGKLVVLYNFIDKVKDVNNEMKDYVLYFGRYSEEKGVDTLLKVCDSLPDIPFVFAGDGPLKEKISLHDNVKDVGFLRGEKLKTVISNSKFVVFPSQWYENCPFSVMEAQHYGVPVIASRIGGVPELVQDGKTGVLFEAGNENELCDKIRKLWENKQIREKYAENCKNVKYDSSEEYCRKLLELYDRL